MVNLALQTIDLKYLLGEWKQMFGRATISRDIWAGITVGLVAFPLNLALAIAAGVPPAVGITTGIIAGLIGGLFGGKNMPANCQAMRWLPV
jgi:SulP family sulfate permease